MDVKGSFSIKRVFYGLLCFSVFFSKDSLGTGGYNVCGKKSGNTYTSIGMSEIWNRFPSNFVYFLEGYGIKNCSVNKECACYMGLRKLGKLSGSSFGERVAPFDCKGGSDYYCAVMPMVNYMNDGRYRFAAKAIANDKTDCSKGYCKDVKECLKGTKSACDSVISSQCKSLTSSACMNLFSTYSFTYSRGLKLKWPDILEEHSSKGNNIANGKNIAIAQKCRKSEKDSCKVLARECRKVDDIACTLIIKSQLSNQLVSIVTDGESSNADVDSVLSALHNVCCSSHDCGPYETAYRSWYETTEVPIGC